MDWLEPPVALSREARTVLERRYLARGADGQLLESAEGLFRRVARAAAAPDRAWGRDPAVAEEAFYRRMARLEFLPNSPALRNAGREPGQLAACFVVPVEDSIEGVFDAVKWAAMIQVSGGGTGFDFSRLQARGTPAGPEGLLASGPLSYLRVFNEATDAVRPSSMRRGANMGILRVDHPDIEAFLAAKREPSALTNFNLSVALTDEFMEALSAQGSVPLRRPGTGENVGSVDAAGLFERLAGSAWASGEPGVLFIDRIDADNPTPSLGRIEATNPCSEQPLLPFEACVLGSIDVGRFAGPEGIAWDRLGEAVADGVHFLDNLIDANRFPLPQTAQMTRNNRKIGLGVMGFADLLIRLGLPYASEEGVATAGELMDFVERESRRASARLASERGPFPNFRGSRWDLPGAPGVRNATTTTIAPTGTLSLLAGCSGGIEPLYALAYRRRALEGERMELRSPLLRRELEKRGLAADRILESVASTGSLQEQGGVPGDLKALFRTALEIAPEWHLKMQAAFQAHVHSAVSKTINFPRSATRDDVGRAFRRAWELGCKGVTVYRDGSRPQQVLEAGSSIPCPDCT